ncbi:MAG: hypothetical protein FJ398_05970 [Verrucomicrobia bacterium]|nr:hypothetical protein [Verrucomicrobiota bacterium]
MNKPTLNSATLAHGRILREPVGFENGYWVGAPGAFYAADEKALYLTYRIRRPRGVAPDRGGEARIARSTDFQNFQDVWSVTKDQCRSASIERCALRKGPDGQWRYFACFVDPADGRWCVEVIEAPEIRTLDPACSQRLFSAQPLGLEGVKDPWILEERGTFHMFLSVAIKTPKTRDGSHATLDIFNTGECVSATGLAISTDLENWDWQGVVFAPEGRGWDAYCRRINSVVPHEGKYFAFYDGSASHLENYEEKTGLAVSTDLRNWRSLTPEGSCLASPESSHSLRYVDAPVIDGCLRLFYEFARADGAHDLRCVRADLGLGSFARKAD